MTPLPSSDFWNGKRVFLTGHTGFKGSWMRLWLNKLGAEAAGYALAPDQKPSLHELIGGATSSTETIADIRDQAKLSTAIEGFDPQILIHMAAQPLVRRSYSSPDETLDVNVMGTVRVLEAARKAKSLRAVLIVTTDKVYWNSGAGRRFSEGDRLGGADPYSASKAACELVAGCYRQAFLEKTGVRVATARAGNVLGGGDFSEDRLVPDLVRAALKGVPPAIRNPFATRPWQHVLDCLCGYLLFAEALYEDRIGAKALNFGPALHEPQLAVQEVATAVQKAMSIKKNWFAFAEDAQLPEMQTLGLDPSLAARTLDWRCRLSQRETIEWTADWYRDWRRGEDARKLTLAQIDAFMKGSLDHVSSVPLLPIPAAPNRRRSRRNAVVEFVS